MVQGNAAFIALAKKHGFNPVFLRDILWHRSQGLNNSEIAVATGISRNTVNAYVDKVRKLENQEVVAKLVLFAIAAVAGGAILGAIFGGEK